MERFAAVAREIGALTGTRCALGPQRRVSGGSINECYLWPAAAGPMFVKLAPPEARAMLAAEAAGLAELERSRTVRDRSSPASPADRKSTRLNSSHLVISYAVFCLKKKTHQEHTRQGD